MDKLKFAAVMVIGAITLSVIIATSVLTGLNATTGTIDVALITVAASAITGIVLGKDKDTDKDKS